MSEETSHLSFFNGEPPLPQSAGYAIILGFGIFFSVFTTLMVYLDKKYTGTVITSEEFNTAGRSVKTGLTASVIVSQWTWAATLLQSSSVAWKYGISGPFWYGAGACIQIFLFGIIAIEVKRRAPTAHTVCEIIQARWGNVAHKVFLYFSLLCNIIVSSMLLLGGAATVNALTGVDLNVASFLIPFGVIAYTMAGGLKATFMASYIHTSIIMILLVTFVVTVYFFGDDIGNFDKMYDLLQKNSKYTEQECVVLGHDACGPVEGNHDGSYLTMLSSGGLMFGVINIIGNFGTVFVDQSYWQSAIAAKPSAAVRGYMLGGLVWFTIPFTLATSLGLACLALNLPVSIEEANAGLVPPAAAVYLLGTPGAYLMSIMLFMAVVSTGSAELIAVSSIVVYDIYRAYFNPKATGDDIIRYSRYVIVTFGVSMGFLSLLLNWIGLTLGWVYLFMGILIGSAVIPIASCLLWNKATAFAAITAAIVGNISAIASWLITAYAMHGELTLDSTGDNIPMLVGNLVAIFLSGFILITLSLWNPDDYDFVSMRNIKQVENDESGLSEEDLDEDMLVKAKNWIMKRGIFFTVLIIIVWPALSIPAGVFTRSFFKLWVTVAIVWGLLATIVITTLPLYESKDAIIAVLKGLFSSSSSPKPKNALEVKDTRLLAENDSNDIRNSA